MELLGVAMVSAGNEVLTIGHSSLPYEGFVELLRKAGVTAVADVRSAPYSRHYPQFNRETLKAELKADGIEYSFLGEELGGRPTDRRLFCDGVADYEGMAREASFVKGSTASSRAANATAWHSCCQLMYLISADHSPLPAKRDQSRKRDRSKILQIAIRKSM